MFFLIPVGRNTSMIKLPIMTVLLIVSTTITTFISFHSEAQYQIHHGPGSQIYELAHTLLSLAQECDTLSTETKLKILNESSNLGFPSKETNTIFRKVNNELMALTPEQQTLWTQTYQQYNQSWTDLQMKKIPNASVFVRFGFNPNNGYFPGLLTHMFLHAGLGHLIFNMLFLWIAGFGIEERWGPFLFLGIYFGGGMLAALAQHWIAPLGLVSAVGASGAIAALMGAFLIRHAKMPIRMFYFLFYGFRPKTGFFNAPAWILLAVWFLEQTVRILATTKTKSPVGYGAHLGGFLVGVLAGFIISKCGLAKQWEIEADATPAGQQQKMQEAERLFQAGQVKESQLIFEQYLSNHPTSLPAMMGLLKTNKYLDQKGNCSSLATKAIAAAINEGKFQLAGTLFEQWNNTLRGSPLNEKDILSLAQSLTILEQYNEALYWYNELGKRFPLSPFIGKAIFSAGKILKEALHQPEQANRCFERLLRKPFDSQWASIAREEITKK